MDVCRALRSISFYEIKYWTWFSVNFLGLFVKDNDNTVYDLTGTELWTMSIGHVFMMWVDTHEETILYI